MHIENHYPFKGDFEHVPMERTLPRLLQSQLTKMDDELSQLIQNTNLSSREIFEKFREIKQLKENFQNELTQKSNIVWLGEKTLTGLENIDARLSYLNQIFFKELILADKENSKLEVFFDKNRYSLKKSSMWQIDLFSFVLIIQDLISYLTELLKYLHRSNLKRYYCYQIKKGIDQLETMKSHYQPHLSSELKKLHSEIIQYGLKHQRINLKNIISVKMIDWKRVEREGLFLKKEQLFLLRDLDHFRSAIKTSHNELRLSLKIYHFNEHDIDSAWNEKAKTLALHSKKIRSNQSLSHQIFKDCGELLNDLHIVEKAIVN